MASISAAGLGKAEINAIEMRNPNLAAEIGRLNERIVNGRNSSEDLEQFIRLLFNADEKNRSEVMLRAAIEARGDKFYLLYSELFGNSPEVILARGIEDFQRQFGVFLFEPHPLRFLQIEYSAKVPKDSELNRFSTFADDQIYTAAFSCYEPSALVSVDLQSEGDETALPLNWDGSIWATPGWFKGCVVK